MVNALVNLQDPILTTLENPAMPADTLVGLQDLQEPIVTTAAVSPSPQEPIVTSSATSPLPERVRQLLLLLQKGCVYRSRSSLHQLSLLHKNRYV
jgi:hypothetical protein